MKNSIQKGANLQNAYAQGGSPRQVGKMMLMTMMLLLLLMMMMMMMMMIMKRHSPSFGKVCPIGHHLLGEADLCIVVVLRPVQWLVIKVHVNGHKWNLSQYNIRNTADVIQEKYTHMYTWPNTNANNWPNTNTWSNTDTWPNTNTWPSPNSNTWPNTNTNTWPNTKAISSACNAPLQIGQGEFEARCVMKT